MLNNCKKKKKKYDIDSILLFWICRKNDLSRYFIQVGTIIIVIGKGTSTNQNVSNSNI